MSPAAERVNIATIGATAFVLFVLLVSGCERASVQAREATKQEAIKAGLVEGEYGYWRKPGQERLER